ncbi:hypothetical protein LPJ57_008417, partial [Coemansia sp. RSA 486]
RRAGFRQKAADVGAGAQFGQAVLKEDPHASIHGGGVQGVRRSAQAGSAQEVCVRRRAVYRRAATEAYAHQRQWQRQRQSQCKHACPRKQEAEEAQV